MAQSEISHLDIVIPVFRNESTLEELSDRIIQQFRECCNKRHRLIFVDDGSDDSSWETIQDIKSLHQEVIGIKLSRNFGQHAAIAAGFQITDAQVTVLMDADLEDKPEDLPLFVQEIDFGADLAVGIDADGVRRNTSKIYRKLLSRIAPGPKQHNSEVTYRAMSKRFLLELNKYSETELIYGSVMSTLGFAQVYVPIHRDRSKGTISSYNFNKRLQIAIKSLVAHSEKIPAFFLFLAIFASVSAGIFAVIVALQSFIFGAQLPAGITMIIFLILIGISIQMLSFAFIGVLCVALVKETKNRPRYHIQEFI